MRLKHREVCFLIGHGGAVLWADASDSPLAMPDSRERWGRIWALRDQLAEIAHTHPLGPLAFSAVDETTIEALTAALGRPLRFSVVAPNGVVSRYDGQDALVSEAPFWVPLIRAASGMPEGEPT